VVVDKPMDSAALLCARRQKAQAEQVLVQIFSLLSLKHGMGTVAERAQTHSTSLDDVSITHERRQRSSISAATTAALEGRNAYLPLKSPRPPWSGAVDDGFLHRRTAVLAIGHNRPACGDAKIQLRRTEEKRAKIASQW